jgi:beta-glucosidase
VTLRAALQVRCDAARTKLFYAKGTEILTDSDAGFDDAIAVARKADVVILALGESGLKMTGESSSLTRLDLPGNQERLLETITRLGKPTVLVLFDGRPLAIKWAAAHVPAILEAWYPGEEGGTAVAGAIAGDFSPAGRLPVTFYKSVDQLPAFEDYSMAKRTYRYFDGEPLYPFGYGLSYTSFSYKGERFEHGKISAHDGAKISVDVTNKGSMAGDEVVELYLTHAGVQGAAIRALKGFQRVHLDKGEKKTVTFTLDNRDLSIVDPEGKRRVVAGPVDVWIGGGQPVRRAGTPETSGVRTRLTITAEATLPD